MKIIGLVLALIIGISSPLHAQGEPLRVAVDTFAPPFVMESANNQLYGFDIAMMQSLCRIMERTCQFVPVPFEDIFATIETRRADVGVSAIIITAERASRVNFSLPYLLSYARFLGPKKWVGQTFRLQLLTDQTVGVSEGTIFPEVVKTLGIANVKTVKFDRLDSMIEALEEGDIDFALMDEPTALYWQSQSSGSLTVVGEPFIYGFGLGIAVNRGETDLLQVLNKALLQYQNSDEFKLNYQKYIAHF
ncbi:TPA: transporter substrate-binding domain-containing protein [Legionella feeleii]|uniref:Putative amino acid ABC transporter, periplasmic binding protein n=1 Tax=Legionella feeleii TaxID=453 RepID=A0A378J0K8_9GAMM|nr:transporter substrate-binding domain-containing protein [Legionella feeleii]STX37814.1 putative amino acid ABC transporter, periplasmic binding protein [Legionella feeleii]